MQLQLYHCLIGSLTPSRYFEQDNLIHPVESLSVQIQLLLQFVQESLLGLEESVSKTGEIYEV